MNQLLYKDCHKLGVFNSGGVSVQYHEAVLSHFKEKHEYSTTWLKSVIQYYYVDSFPTFSSISKPLKY